MPATPEPLEPRSRPWIWAVYLFLFAASVPWYLPAGSPARIWFGLPHWVVLSLSACLAVALFTAYVVARCWSAPPSGEDPDDAHAPAPDSTAAVRSAPPSGEDPDGREGAA